VVRSLGKWLLCRLPEVNSGVKLADQAEKWEHVSDDELGDYEVFTVHRLRRRSPRNDKVVPFHVLDLPDWVVVIPLTAAGDVVMVEQFRAAADAVTLEFPSGRVDEGEDPVAAALRELEEETGYVSRDARVLARVTPDPGLLRNIMTVVLAVGCEEGGERDQDEGEDVHVRTVAADDVQPMILRGDIRHVNAIAPWYLYDIERRRNNSPRAPTSPPGRAAGDDAPTGRAYDSDDSAGPA
jgi:ADP-ribose pyrophosphatase